MKRFTILSEYSKLSTYVFRFALAVFPIVASLVVGCLPSVSESPYTWTQLLLTGKEPSQYMNALVADNDGQLVAVGQEVQWASVWRSQNGGENWMQAWNNSQETEDSVMNDVITGPVPKFIAVGQQGGNAIVWASTDGTVWTEVFQETAAPSSEMKALARTESGFVAVGWAFQSGQPG